MSEMKESGLLFQFEDETYYDIETEKGNISSCKQHVMVCECVVCPINGKLKDKVVFIEAKSSAPNKANCKIGVVTNDGVEIDPEHWLLLSPLDIFARDICQKFIDSFSLWQSIHDKFHLDKIKLPRHARKVKNGDHPIFVLVLNNFKEEWLEPVKYAIENEFRHFLHACNIKPTALKVVNHEMAREQVGLNVAPIAINDIKK